jgi:hypothetical protein
MTIILFVNQFPMPSSAIPSSLTLKSFLLLLWRSWSEVAGGWDIPWLLGSPEEEQLGAAP